MNELPKTIKPGETIEVQLAPYGEYPCRDGDPEHEGFIQLVTPAAVARMVEAFSGEILVDFDHSSELSPRTEAAGWVTGLRVDAEKGLMGWLKFTDIGAEAVTNRRYRFVSVVWDVDIETKKVGEPQRLTSVALTNKPNLPVAPMLNRRAATTNQTAATPKQPKDTPMEKIKELLGLEPDATQEAVEQAIAALQASLKEYAAQAAEAEADAFANENSTDDEEKKTLKNAFLANSDVAKQMATLIKKPKAGAPAPPITNAAKAKPPASFMGGFAAANKPVLNALQQYDAMPDGKAKREFLRNNALAINDLRNAASAAE